MRKSFLQEEKSTHGNLQNGKNNKCMHANKMWANEVFNPKKLDTYFLEV